LPPGTIIGYSASGTATHCVILSNGDVYFRSTDPTGPFVFTPAYPPQYVGNFFDSQPTNVSLSKWSEIKSRFVQPK
jgi:hypothetical protein